MFLEAVSRIRWAPIVLLPVTAAAQAPGSLLDLSIEELSRVQVTTVSRRAESRSDAAASIFVITRDEIRRSGFRMLPELLRLAPGVEVARTGAHSWIISMRGFSSDLSNKLLVLIDGRSVYSPLYAGVFWDAQDLPLEDIERIEVIAGPGGTLWGANAVNGVINIITRSAWDTLGGSATVGAGNELEAFGTARYAGRIGDDVAWRSYVEHTEFDSALTPSGEDARDDWRRSQAGFRFDTILTPDDSLTVQGDVYAARERARLRTDIALGELPEMYEGFINLDGFNVLTRWRRELGRGTSMRLQGYLDRTDRDIPGTYREKRDTLDLDFQHQLPPRGRHALVWGAGIRVTRDDLANTTFASFDPASRTDRTYSAFLQDQIQFADGRVFLTLGSKFEHNDYSGFEYQPSARASWLVSDRQTVWGALSRAVRTPARLNEDLSLLTAIELPGLEVPLYVSVLGDPDFRSEDLLAREIGYRLNFRRDVSFDITLFEHEYDRLATNETGTPTVVEGPSGYILLPIVQGNGMQGESSGATVSINWQPLDVWRMKWQYTYLDLDLRTREGSNDTESPKVAGNSPRHHLALQTFIDLRDNLALYTGIRRVSELPNPGVPAYTAVDLSLTWHPTEKLGTTLTARNLNDERHVEFGEGAAIERSVYLSVSWTF